MAGWQQRLGLFDGTMLVAGSMIGSGIFIVSAEIVRDVGGAGWLLVVWAIAGVMTILGALAYAELAAMYPHAGGQYVYLREAFGPLWGFLYGWTAFTVIQTGTIAAVGVAFAKFLGVFAPALGTEGAEALVLLAAPVRITVGHLLGVGLIVLLTWWNTRGIDGGRWVQNLFTVAKIGALAALIGVGWWVANPAVWAANTADWWGPIATTKPVQTLGGGTTAAWMVVGGALVGALFSADAWNNVTFTAGEMKQPARNLPLSLVLGTGAVIALYVLANLVYLAVLPLPQIAAAPSDRVGTAVLEVAAPGTGTYWMAGAILISTFGCCNGLILSGARLYYALAQDGLFFRSAGTLNAAGVPAVGLWTQAVWASVLVFSGQYGQLLDYVIFAALMFYGLTVVGLFVLRRTQAERARPYRALGYPVLPGLYVILCGLVMLDLLWVKPLYTWPGLLLVLLGVPVYFGWQAGRPPRPE
jgi:APA family basic amino acid/polyamine antiporter